MLLKSRREREQELIKRIAIAIIMERIEAGKYVDDQYMDDICRRLVYAAAKKAAEY